MPDTPTTEETSATLAGLPQVLDYLQAAGWKVSRSTLYAHRGTGMIPVEVDGTFRQAAVDRYARNHLKQRGADSSAGGSASRKIQADIEYLEARAEMARVKTEALKGGYLLVADHEALLASRARALKVGLLSFFRTNLPDLVLTVEGNMDRIPQALELAEDQVERLLDAYARAGEISPEVAA